MARKSPRTRGVDAMSKISNGEGRGWDDGGAVESEVVRVSEPNVVMLTMLRSASLGLSAAARRTQRRERRCDEKQTLDCGFDDQKKKSKTGRYFERTHAKCPHGVVVCE